MGGTELETLYWAARLSHHDLHTAQALVASG
jgi:hypothetical protein